MLLASVLHQHEVHVPSLPALAVHFQATCLLPHRFSIRNTQKSMDFNLVTLLIAFQGLVGA